MFHLIMSLLGGHIDQSFLLRQIINPTQPPFAFQIEWKKWEEFNYWIYSGFLVVSALKSMEVGEVSQQKLVPCLVYFKGVKGMVKLVPWNTAVVLISRVLLHVQVMYCFPWFVHFSIYYIYREKKGMCVSEGWGAKRLFHPHGYTAAYGPYIVEVTGMCG